MVRVDGELREIAHGMKLDRYKNHDIEVVVDKLAVQAKDGERLRKSVSDTLQQGSGLMMILDADTQATRFYSKQLMDPVSGLSYRDPAPHNFSFNSAQGACPKCKGLGFVSVMDHEKVVPNDKLSIKEGGLAPLGKYRNALIFGKYRLSWPTTIATLKHLLPTFLKRQWTRYSMAVPTACVYLRPRLIPPTTIT